MPQESMVKKVEDQELDHRGVPKRVREIAKWHTKQAILNGKIKIPKVCSSCCQPPRAARDGSRMLEAHHRNYKKPLDILWLCRDCHTKVTRHPRGEYKSHLLTELSIRAIRDLYFLSWMRKDLALLFKVTKGNIDNILTKKIWKQTVEKLEEQNERL